MNIYPISLPPSRSVRRLAPRFAALLGAATAVALALAGCATESQQTLTVTAPVAAATADTYVGPKADLAVGTFDNRSTYLRGIFFDGIDRLGGQAKTILIAHLQETGRFNVLDRDNMAELAKEAQLSGSRQSLHGAAFMISGDVVEFGRRETGDEQLFGLLGSGKVQTAYAKVTLNVIDVLTSQVVYSASGAGEYALSNREVLGFGGTSGYDSTLNGKVLDLAIRDAIDTLVVGIASGEWEPGKSLR